MEILKQINKVLAWPVIGAIWIYQKTISPDHSLLKIFFPHGYCKFYPSCSEYARQTLVKDGIIGLPKAVNRVLSCTPQSLGGVDLP